MPDCHAPHRGIARLGAFALLVSALAGWHCAGPGATKRRQGPSEDHRKVFTGQSFVGQTHLAALPSPSLTAPGFDTERAWSGQDDWEPAIACDPTSDRVYLLTTRFAGPQPKIALRRSDDAGATWSLDTKIPDTGNDQNDPQIAVANDGTVFVVWLDVWTTKLIQSSDHGVTWTPPVDVHQAPITSSDHPWLVISPDGNDVYVAFNWGHSYVAASHDHGQTFAPAVRTDNDGRTWFHSGGGVTPSGDVVIGAVDYRGTLLGPSHVNVLLSTDGGASFTTTRLDTSQQPPDCPWAAGCYHGFLGPFVGLAVDSAGTMLAAYNAGDHADGPQQIYVRSSLDGVTWTERQAISQGAVLTDNAFPLVAAGASPGDFRVVWQADLAGDVTAWNTFHCRSLDGGLRFGPTLRISDRPGGAPYKGIDGYRFPYGDYLGLAVGSRGLSHVVWGEGRSWNGPGGTWFTRGR